MVALIWRDSDRLTPGDRLARVKLYLANLVTVVGYLIKGICPNAGVTLELERMTAQGRVMGKRCGWSANIKRAFVVQD